MSNWPKDAGLCSLNSRKWMAVAIWWFMELDKTGHPFLETMPLKLLHPCLERKARWTPFYPMSYNRSCSPSVKVSWKTLDWCGGSLDWETCSHYIPLKKVVTALFFACGWGSYGFYGWWVVVFNYLLVVVNCRVASTEVWECWSIVVLCCNFLDHLQGFLYSNKPIGFSFSIL